MRRKIIFFDIDGTLVAFNGEMSASTRQALQQARSNGHLIILCTGRSRCQIYPWLLDFGFDGIIASTGAYVEFDNKVIYRHLIDQAHLTDIMNYFDTVHAPYMFQSADAVVSTEWSFRQIADLFYDTMHISLEDIGKLFGECYTTFGPADTPAAEKLVYYECPENIAAVSRHLGPYFTVTPSSFDKPDESKGEITCTDITKGTGMSQMIQHLGILREDTLAIGDGPNDFEMLEFAQTGIAMGNGNPDLKAMADYVTTDITTDGIAHALSHYHII